MKQNKLSKNSKRKGQTMMEYIVLVALLAVASIPVVKVLGDTFRDRVLNAADAMVGGAGGVKNEGGQIVKTGNKNKRRDMTDFHETK